MSGDYTYYDSGFFGFGGSGAFRPYSLMHLFPLLLCAIAIFLVFRYKDFFKSWKHEERFRYILSFLMFMQEFGFFVWLLYVGDTSGKYLMMAKLPLHLCDIGLISCMYMVTSKNRTLFGFNFFVTLFGAVLACIIPQTVLSDVTPSHFRYYQYFGEHLLPIFSTLYMMIVHDMRPRYRDIWATMLALTVMLIPSFALNRAFPGSDYMFLTLDIPGFPKSQYLKALVYAVLITLIFHLMWYAFLFVMKKRQKLQSQ